MEGLMTLGDVTFTYNPKISFPVIKPKVINSVIETYSGIAYFSWGPQIVGQEIPLEWEWMPEAQFAAINTLYQADDEVVFNPNNSTNTYNVRIKDFDGIYYVSKTTGTDVIRKNVKLNLLIMSQV